MLSLQVPFKFLCLYACVGQSFHSKWCSGVLAPLLCPKTQIRISNNKRLYLRRLLLFRIVCTVLQRLDCGSITLSRLLLVHDKIVSTETQPDPSLKIPFNVNSKANPITSEKFHRNATRSGHDKIISVKTQPKLKWNF